MKNFLLAIVFITLVSILDGSREYWNLDFLKYLPNIIVLISLVFLIPKYIPKRAILIFIISIWIFIGSSISLFSGIELSNSFFGRALSTFFLIYGFLYVIRFNISHTEKLISPFLKIFSILMFFAVVLFIYFDQTIFGANYTNVSQLYHNELFIPLLLPWLFFKQIKPLNFLILLLFVSAICGSSGKYTDAILAITNILGGIFIYRKSFISSSNLSFTLPIMILSLIVITTIAIESTTNRLDLVNEYSVRNNALQINLEKFWDSPFFGTFFISESRLEINRDLLIISHLDYLDLLSNGGLIWFSIYLYLKLKALQEASKTLSNSDSGIIFSAMFMLCSISLFVNPLLTAPQTAFYYWFSMGALLAKRFN